MTKTQFRKFYIRVLSKSVNSQRDDGSEKNSCGYDHNLRALYSLTDVDSFEIAKAPVGRTRWRKRVFLKNVYCFVEKREGKRQSARPRRKWEVKVD